MSYGVKRVEKQIQFIVSNTLLHELEDPDLGFVTVTGVDLSSDFKQAVVRVSIMGDEDGKKTSLQALERARGVMQRKVGKGLQTRRIPQLNFELDETLDKKLHMDKIFDKLAAERAKNKEGEGEAEPSSTEAEGSNPPSE